MQISTFDAKTHLSALLDKVIQTGEPIIITRRGEPVAQIAPIERKPDSKARAAIEAIKALSQKHTLGRNLTLRDLVGRDSH